MTDTYSCIGKYAVLRLRLAQYSLLILSVEGIIKRLRTARFSRRREFGSRNGCK